MSNVFEFAMQMELDGKAYYEKMATETEVPALKKILSELAVDEDRHYNIFKRLMEKQGDDLGELSEKTTLIAATTKNVFQELKEAGTEIASQSDVIAVWKQAQDVEKKSEDFYREKANEVDDPKGKEMLTRIADEEAKHWAVIEAVMQFLNKPNSFLADAEWGNLNDN